MRRESPPPVERNERGARTDVRARLSRLRGSRQRTPLGLPELVGLLAAALLLFVTLLSYFYFLVPARSRLRQAGEDRERLQKELMLANAGKQEGETTQASVEKIVESLQTFESEHLVPRAAAGNAVIEELNQLITRNRLRLSTGVSFTQFEEIAPDATPQQRAQISTGAVKAIQNIFPGVGVSLTVEGSYTNLRRFVRDVEADPRFIVINDIELEGVTDATTRMPTTDLGAEGVVPGAPGASAPTTRGATLVSLRLNMGAYFRRLNAPETSAPTGAERAR